MKKETQKTLENLAGNGDLVAFGRLLAEQNIYAFVPKRPEEKTEEFVLAAKAQVLVSSQKISAVIIYSSEDEAKAFLKGTWAKLLGPEPMEVAEFKGQSLLFSVAARGLSLWFNPKLAETDSLADGRLFSPAETLNLIGSITLPPSINPIIEEVQLLPPAIQDLDLTKSRTQAEILDIFHDEKPAEICRRLTRLVDRGIIGTEPSPFDKEIKLYEPLAVFYLGFESYTARGREFRGWFKRLITTAYFERTGSAKEIMALLNENREIKKELQFSESFKQKVKREYQKLRAKLEEEKIASSEAMNLVLLELQNERIKKLNDDATIERLYRKVALLENDIRALEEWPYPTTLEDVLNAAEKLYSSKLIIAPGKNRIEVSDQGMERLPGLVAEAIKMIKSLTGCLYPMRYNYGDFNLIKFKTDTGLEIIMPHNSELASSTLCTRRVDWQGQSYVCNNYLQSSKDNCRLLIHFTFLEEERKILISHITTFAISGLFKIAT
jgi:hypothetical protein